jgi:hypothetical protein
MPEPLTDIQAARTYSLDGLSARHVEALRDILKQAQRLNAAQLEAKAFIVKALDDIDLRCCNHPQCGRYGYCPMSM